ncbi:MAG TPA: ABC transporter substrate-binding protein [Burkholderiaceae bacterium]|jgi:ABC-type nitrate/sulfonate/bicarbonate transport system substrate-binding protein|nr:ABC transporter substrate-binding protein [Burkholderiaceae bacterium]
MTLRSKLLAGVTGLLITGSMWIAGSAGAADAVPPVKVEGGLQVVKLAWGPGASWDFAYAQHVNVWRRFGLKVDMVEGANGAALLSFLGSGEIHTATMAPSAMIVANSIGINLRVVYADASTTKLGLYANPASGMTADPRTWKGKNIGIAKNSQADYALRWSLQKAGMKPSDVNMVVLAPPVAVPAYQRNQIDGYYVWDVWGARLEASGAKLVQRAVDVGFPSSSIWTMTKEFLAANPDVAARFVASLNQANIEMRDALAKGGPDAEVVYAAIGKANGVDRAAAEQLLKAQPPATIQTLLSADSPLSLVSATGLAAQVAQQARIAVEAEAIKQAPANPADLIAPRSLLDEALKIKDSRGSR